MNPSRRKLLGNLAAGGSLAVAAPFLIRQALAMGDKLYTQGFHKLQGRVMLNNNPAKAGDLVASLVKLCEGRPQSLPPIVPSVLKNHFHPIR